MDSPKPIKEASDVWGDRWDVYEERPTDYVFSLLLGWPAGTYRSGWRTLIITEALANHLFACAELRRSHDLPIGNNTIKKARRLLGIDWRKERAAWWDERFDDLATMTVEEFASTHGVSVGAVVQARHAAFGPKLRPAFWWKEPSVARALLADRPAADVADELGLTAMSVRRLRRMLGPRKQASAGGCYSNGEGA